MNGAEALIRTLAAGGLETVFANPGSSEMYLVDALVREPGLNCVLCLHENVVTGAADGYGRMADKPAATLLHLGPGLANGLSNIHNSSRAHAPMINVVGDHATYHRQYPAPLTTDIRRIAEPFSHAVDSIETIGDVGPAAARTVTAALAPPGRIVTLIAPADMTWLEGAEPAGVPPAPAPARVPDSAIEAAAREIRSGDLVLLLLAARCFEVCELGYLGCDIVIDRDKGPLILELNARPGLSIQIANNRGLLPRLRRVQRLNTRKMALLERVQYAKNELDR